jgi:ATP/ADP translocase
MTTFLWILLSVIYVVVLITLGVATLRKGHVFLFIIGIFIPFLWLIGALIAPTPRAAGAV